MATERSGPAGPRLIGYVAADATPAELIDFAASRLPYYMMPAAIVVLPALPVTPSGKVDRRVAGAGPGSRWPGRGGHRPAAAAH